MQFSVMVVARLQRDRLIPYFVVNLSRTRLAISLGIHVHIKSDLSVLHSSSVLVFRGEHSF